MLLIQILAKILFLPLYIFLFLIALFLYLFNTAVNNQFSFDECLETVLIKYYWDFD